MDGQIYPATCTSDIATAESTYDSKHAQHVIKVAASELEYLLRQQAAISKKVKEVKRTVKGLAMLFGMEAIGTTDPNRNDNPPTIGPGATVSKKPDRETERAGPRSSNQSDLPSHESFKSKLERACRIALLEAEEPASATQVYDRILRRGSYRLLRYKHPLARVIKTLNMLGSRGEVNVIIIEGDCRKWLWNNAATTDLGDHFSPSVTPASVFINI